jgi:signal transduction histidine kinase
MEAMGALARGIAHDFNNILWSISGNTEFVLLNLSDRAIAKATLEDILKSCNRAKDLINQILTFSRKDERELKPVNIKPIIKEAIKLLRATLPATIEIREHIEKNLGLIKADPTQIYQVIVNLCTNAEHAMRENGGILEVNLKKVDIKKAITSLEFDLLPGKYLRLSVKDTGHGMSSKMVEQIFEPYFTTKKRDEGTGLGLAVVRGIVKGHVGAIIVESEPGKGTNFHVYFPKIKSQKI